jgi:short-subunit dehydrogenase
LGEAFVKVFITGITSGLGHALALEYLKAGAIVGGCGRDEKKLPQDLQGRVKVYSADVSDRQRLIEVIDQFGQEAGGLDIVIANAGRSVGKKGPEQNFDLSREVVETNILGLMNTFEGALKWMLPQKRGQLVAISSVAGFIGLPGAGAYSGTKAYVTIYCEGIALDLRRVGIDVTVLCPGFVDTPLTQVNNHAMPFLMSAERAGQLMKRAIDQKKSLYLFPWQMKWLILFLHKMPRFLYRWIMSSKWVKYGS